MSIFSYESKFSQTLMFVADLCLLNLCFVLCCLPIFTIGAAQSALYAGIRTLQDPENDESPVKAFFKAFPVGFGSITGISLVFMATEFLMTSILYGMLKVEGFPAWTAIVSLAVLMLFHAQIPLFHARFTCTGGQLLRNSFLLVLAHPLRSLLVAALIWLPVIVFLWDVTLFAPAIPAWLLLYYAVAFMLSFNIMKKPFRTLIDHYNQTHDPDGNIILATMDEEGNLIYEGSIQEKMDEEAAQLADKEAQWEE